MMAVNKRTDKLVLILHAMLEGADVWVWSKLGHWVKTRVTEIRLSGIVFVRGLDGAYEPGQIRLEPPPESERRTEQHA